MTFKKTLDRNTINYNNISLENIIKDSETWCIFVPYNKKNIHPIHIENLHNNLIHYNKKTIYDILSMRCDIEEETAVFMSRSNDGRNSYIIMKDTDDDYTGFTYYQVENILENISENTNDNT